MRIAPLTAVLLALALSGTAWADPPAKAAPSRPKAPSHHAAAAQPQVHAKAKPSLADLAAHGDSEAQFQLGMAALENKGKGEKKAKGGKTNQAEALEWFTVAAGNGNKDAALGAARILEQRGNLGLAAHWWYRAGELGDLPARTHLLDLYLDGKVPSIGGNAAASWLAARADGDDSQAQRALGDLYERGRGIPVDLAQAQRWYLAAALDGDFEAMFRLGKLQLSLPALWRAHGKETGKDGKWLGPAIAPTRPAARTRDSLDLGRQAVAQEMGVEPETLTLYRPGLVEGEHWLRLAARYGHVGAQYALGRAYIDGVDLPLDMIAGIQWLEAAAWQHDPQALLVLADLAAKGQGFPAKDPVRAWADYDLAASLGAHAAEDPRDRLGKALTPRQLTRARQLAQDLRDQGM